MPFRRVSVDDTVTQLAPYDPRRVSLMIANDAGSTVYISTNRLNVTETGIPLTAGEKIAFSVDRGDAPAEELNGQCLTGLSADVRIYESYEKTE